MKHVIKQSGKAQGFSSKKLSASIEHTLVSNHYSPERAKSIAQDTTSQVVKWLAKKTEVTYLDIRTYAAKILSKHDKNVGFLYKKHKDLW